MMLETAVQLATHTLDARAQEVRAMGGSEEKATDYAVAAQRLRAFLAGWRDLMHTGGIESDYRADEYARATRK